MNATADRRVLWISGTISALLFLAMALHSSPLSPGIPCLQLTFDATAFKSILEQWGTSGVERFRSHFLIDFPFLVSYGLFGRQFGKRSGLFPTTSLQLRAAATWLLPAAALGDAGENLLHLYLTADQASPPAVLYPLAGSIAGCKWLLIGSFVAVTAVTAVALWRARRPQVL